VLKVPKEADTDTEEAEPLGVSKTEHPLEVLPLVALSTLDADVQEEGETATSAYAERAVLKVARTAIMSFACRPLIAYVFTSVLLPENA
jgi:hypothetical protein